ncbi:MAG TPA: glycerol-3-phosphate dehydrogenase/oxidase [Acidimicrobiales bacterium]|nr:glycerol-3-phosphate dehydrogenase/oxidase [Acidimicrobiales bacterium]
MKRPHTSFDRGVALQRLASEDFDVLVIGGGITGAGVALDSAARGLRTALVERADFASGTSSKSSKLVHGGLRYLQQKEFLLVHENLVERHRLLRNAPHLVEPLTFLIPLFGRGGVVDKSIVKGFSVALWLYDIGGGWRIGKRHAKVSAEEIYAHLPTLRRGRVVAGFLYYDARADDARLTLTVARTAVLEHGAVAANYAAETSLLTDSSGRIRGARVVPLALEGALGPAGGEESFEVRAKVVVNATGVWADEVRSLDSGVLFHELRPAKGVHLTVGRSKLPCDVAAVLPAGERRSIFVIPWGDYTYLGTTDTDYTGELDDAEVAGDDVDYLLAAVNSVVTEPISRADVTAAWAGLRPLLAATPHHRAPSERTADLSRRHRVIVSSDGLVTITGGKLTTYRKMAEDTVAAVGQVLGRKLGPSPTKRLKLRGAEGAGSPGSLGSLGSPAALARRYGGEAPAVASLISQRSELGQPLVPGLPYVAAEAVYAVRYEMAQRLEDVLSRRTRALLLDASASREAAAGVAELMAAELGWDASRTAAEIASLHDLVDRELAAVKEPASEVSPASPTNTDRPAPRSDPGVEVGA